MAVTDSLLGNNSSYSSGFDKGDLPLPPGKKVGVLAGMETFFDGPVKDQIEADTALRPSFALEAFPEAEADVRQSLARVRANPFIPNKESVRGFVYEVETGKLREVL